MMLRRLVVALTAWWVLAGSTAAEAYLDAGSGSMMLQLLLGGLAGVAVALRLYWRRMLEAFGLRKPGPPAREGQSPVPGTDGEPRR